ncbi:hypothetical protein FKG94_25045 [Exilibacterium tricleocarpae]|uniref:Uncharacterized protein n=1 Tax=Exilibacterium tricleocarpae TaxID=2591008 RepID=A0A545SS53_9GAMM|nr:PA1571 family protein [Exilibacterium tricleocarpae]TQV67799.1 hypothetical protein FKG94_25045 [Exilibacterium tricleocarpae]
MTDANRDAGTRPRATAPDGGDRTDYRGGAVIDSNGREVPITDAMVEQALQELDYNNQGLGNSHR